MAGRDKESQEIMSAAMQYVKTGDRSKLESFTFASLKKADYQLGNSDEGSGYRRAIKDLINELGNEHVASNQPNSINAKPFRNFLQNIFHKTWHESFFGKILVGLVIGVLLIFIAFYINNSLLNTSPPQNSQKQAAVIKNIEIPINIESTWNEYSDLDRKAEFYIVKNESPLMQTVIYSGSAKVKIPKNGLTVNEMISIAPNKTTRTTLILPKVVILNQYLNEGGYEIQIVLFNQYGKVYKHMKQKLFDREILNRGINFWFRFMPNKIPNNAFKRDTEKAPRPLT